MLWDHRCARYEARLKELAKSVCLAGGLDQALIHAVASRYADDTQPTLEERFARSEPGELVPAAGAPAPASVWEEDAALVRRLLDVIDMRPTPAMALRLYTASLCRHAGMSVCEESSVAQRRALPEGKCLGDLMTDFLSAEDPLYEAEA